LEAFLEKTAQHLFSTYSDRLSETCIVLPNKRASLFLKQHLSKLIDKPIWLPKIIGPEDLVEQLADVHIVDNVVLLFELYEVYQKSVKEPETFDEFSKWGQLLLHDFNEIDRYLIPTESFFKHINEARALEVWNVGEREITDFQTQYLAFWKHLGELYTAFNKHLKNKSYAYQGMAFRKVAEEINENSEQFIKDKIKWSKTIFIGFNALNKAEETIITELKKQNRAKILWDADAYYLDDKIQESGLFLRQFKKKEVFTPFNWISDKFNTEKKNINIYGIPQNIGQAKYVTSLLNKIDSKSNYRDTCVVLADENMLVPVLQSIPDNIQHINVTMGYPLKNTPINNFFEIYFTTIVNADRFGNKDKLTYHYKDLLKLFQLPFSQIVYGKEACVTIKKHIIKHNWVFINKEKLEYINKQLTLPFSESYELPVVLKSVLSFIEVGRSHYVDNKKNIAGANLELEYLFLYAKLFNQISLLNTDYPFVKTIKGFYSLYRQLLSSHSVELYGEPLQGLQVMGMLETRNIDFKNVILISTNEGVLPAGKTYNSFIPFDIKKAYNLPTHVEKDAVYAYHFYRLIQNAENINILYNTETNEFGSGEQSRFVTQIENELKDKENITISKKLVTYPALKLTSDAITIEKTSEIVDKILQQFKKGLSPSALNSFINCPLDFYYKYVLGIREADEVEETIDHASFGSYVHGVLEALYSKFVDKNITIEDLKVMLKLVPETTYNVFSKTLSDKELKSGKNLLTFNVAQSYITTFLKKEIDFVNKTKEAVYIKSLEKELTATVNVHVEGKEQAVNLKGFADRIDAFGNVVRIIDYKTGVVKPAEINVKAISEVIEPNKKNKAFQVLMYAFIYAQNNELDNIELQTGIISFRKLSSHFMAFKQDKEVSITNEVLEDFKQALNELLANMLDVSQPFEHNHDAKYCKFCN
jgi:ATP-dependent helicase/nuclease subunit B